jgi:hypothetical protein
MATQTIDFSGVIDGAKLDTVPGFGTKFGGLSTISITNERVRVDYASSASWTGYVYTGFEFTQDPNIKAILRLTNDRVSPSLMINRNVDGSCYFARFNNAYVELWERTAGGQFTEIVPDVDFTIAPHNVPAISSTGTEVHLYRVGDLVKVKVGGVEIISHDPASSFTGGYTGIGSYYAIASQDVSFDDVVIFDGVVMGNVFAPFRFTFQGGFPQGTDPESYGPIPQSSFKALNIALSGPGRIGFYVDYSELATTGTHSFYVCRTHGTAGAVSVDYESLGDTHTTVSGSLHWVDGDASIKKVEVIVPTKSVAGDHRMYLQLSNPVSAALHNGTYTRGYGVIDDGTIAIDASAVFYDSAATGGTGTQADPYDSIYTAIANVGAKRYIYGKGTTIPDGTNTANPNGGGGIVNCINFPATRTDESDRLYIRNWPGNTWTVDGGAGNEEIGFYSDGGRNYISWKGIDFSGLHAWASVGSKFAEGGGISNHKIAAFALNVEHCTFDDIDGSTNTSGFNPYKVDGFKVWRSTFNDIAVNGDNDHANAAGILTYDGENGSVQRCNFSLTHNSVYHKRLIDPAIRITTSTSIRFNFSDRSGVHFGRSGSSGSGHFYTIVQGNVFKNASSSQRSGIWHITDNDLQIGEKAWWCGNVFDTCGSGETFPIYFNRVNDTQMFNNIMYNSRACWTSNNVYPNTDVEYADYNDMFGSTAAIEYEYKNVGYATPAALNAFDSRFAGNDITTDPLFTNPATNDYSLQGGSPNLTSGVDGTQSGVYLAGIEVIGA